jgi:hypothetical protein
MENQEATLNKWEAERRDKEQREQEAGKIIADLSQIISGPIEDIKEDLRDALLSPLCYQHGYKAALDCIWGISFTQDKADVLRKYMEENYDI